ncbi:hypothetical protein Hdeb2414_s0013g00405181 [Helianthus debilis subsp. tardiflorus]
MAAAATFSPPASGRPRSERDFDWDSASVQVSVRVNGLVNWFWFGSARVNTVNGSVAGFRLGFGSWSKAVNESMVRSIQSTQVNSGQPVNCRVNWSNARSGIL